MLSFKIGLWVTQPIKVYLYYINADTNSIMLHHS